MKTILRPLLLPLSVWSAATSLCANWPAWRGPEANGVTSEQNLPSEWSDSKNIRWKTPLPDRGNSTPIVWGSRVFITQAIGVENRRTVMSFDRANGRLLWQTGVTYQEKDETHEANPLCSASPVTDGERVIAYFGSAGVYCCDVAGREIWRELAYFEGYTRFEKVFAILGERYGSRFREVRPTPESELYLYGDRLSAPDIVRRLNATLSESSSADTRNPTTRTAVSDTDIVEALKKGGIRQDQASTFVILEGDTARNYFIQFAVQGDRIYCEAVSNHYLIPSNHLTEEQLRRLENLGWRAPEREGQNWFRTFRTSGDADYEDIVSLTRRALRRPTILRATLHC